MAKVIVNPFTGQLELISSGGGGGGSVTAIGLFDSQTPSVNGAVIVAPDLYLQSASGTVPGLVNTGTQTFAGDKSFLGNIFMDGVHTINDVPNPTSPMQVANKAYVDLTTLGLAPRAGVEATTTANITLSGLQTIDGYTTLAGDRILVKNQTLPVNNGIYNAAVGAWTRATDMMVGSSAVGAYVPVINGTTQGNNSYIESANPALVGTDALTFSFFSHNVYFADGLGIIATGGGNIFSLQIDGSTLSQSGSGVKVATGGITDNEINSVADINLTKLAPLTANTLPVTNGLGFLISSSVTATEAGFLSGASSNIQTQLNAKEPAFAGGTTLQYFRGDKTFQTLNTTVVPEGSNLYLTNARVIASTLTGYVSGAGVISSADSVLSAIEKLNGNVNALTTGVSSVFGRTGAVVATSGDYTTTLVTEGTNLYFTNARTLSSTLTGYVSGAGSITAADTVLSAIQKLNGNTAALVTGVSSVFGRTGVVVATSGDYTTTLVTEGTNLYFTNARAIAAPITGYVSGAGVVAATDSILQAIQKLNGNIGALVTGVSSFNSRTGAVVPGSSDYITTQIAEGSNLYFTNARAIASTLTGYVSGAGVITSGDTILTAIQKLNGNIVASGLTFTNSLVNSVGTVTLVNDSASPAANSFYGTNGSGTRGFFLLSTVGFLPLSGGTMTGQINWGTGLGAITHLLGPTDQPFTIKSASPAATGNGQNLVLTGAVATTTGNGGNVNITGGVSAGTGAINGGDVNITGGNTTGLASTSRGGNVNITGGIATASAPATGGNVIISGATLGGAGVGGQTGAGTVQLLTANQANGIPTSDIILKTGNSGGPYVTGDMLFTTGTVGAPGGNIGGEQAGSFKFVAGVGATGVTNGAGIGGAGGDFTFTGAVGGTTTGTGGGGRGSDFIITGAIGGSAAGSATAGRATNFTFTGATGGSTTGTSGTNTAGAGSSAVFTFGAGGNATGASGTRNGGAGGGLSLALGAAGTGATANGVAGQVSITQTLSGSDTTAMLALSPTWNTSGIANGIFMNVTNTSSAITSKLIDLQVATVSQWSVNVVGKMTFVTGSNKSMGTATLSSGTVTVSNTAITANSKVWVQYATGVAPSLGIGSISTLTVPTITAGTSFVITGLTAAGITNTTDTSVVQWWITN